MKLRLQSADVGDLTEFKFPGPSITMGRDMDCALPLPEQLRVSSRHATITLSPDGAYLTDESSANGTYLNDNRITESVNVNVGDCFRLARTGPCYRIIEIELPTAEEAARLVPTGSTGKPHTAAAENAANPSGAIPESHPPVAGTSAYGNDSHYVHGDGSHSEVPPPTPEGVVNRNVPAPPHVTTVEVQTYRGGPVDEHMVEENREMILKLQRNHRRLQYIASFAGVLILGLVAAGGVYFFQKTKDLQKQSEWCQSVYSQNLKSVYYVVLGGADGKPFQTGTAFAIDPGPGSGNDGRLVTTGYIAHHAKKFLEKPDLKDKVRVISPFGRNYKVKHAEAHPQYDDNTKSNAPDLGVLTVELPTGESLPVVDLAGHSDLQKLKTGDPVCYIGYLDWSKYGTEDSSKVPHVYAGTITRLTTLDEELGDPSSQQLIQHEMQTTGGSSGSPIFNRDGKVIAVNKAVSTANEIPTEEKSQPAIIIGPKTGIRIDLLKDLLKKKA